LSAADLQQTSRPVTGERMGKLNNRCTGEYIYYFAYDNRPHDIDVVQAK
jgi:hypothetical protein